MRRCGHTLAPVSEPKLTNPTEVQDVILGLKVGKAPDPDGIPNMARKHLLLGIVSFLVVLFNAILRTQYFPVAWKDARMFSILKRGKAPAMPSSY
jgi:nitrate reductase gamma subunit